MVDDIAIAEALDFTNQLSETTRLGCSALAECGVITFHEQQMVQYTGLDGPEYGDCTDIYTVACRNAECPVLAQFKPPPRVPAD